LVPIVYIIVGIQSQKNESLDIHFVHKKTKPENLFSMNMLNMTYRTGHNREFILLDPFAYFSDEKV